METVKINLGKAIDILNEVNVKLMREEDGMLLIVFSERVYPKIVVGTELVFSRDVYEDGGTNNAFTRKVTVLETFEYTIDGEAYEAVHATIPSKTALSFKSDVNVITVKPSSAACVDYFDGFIPESGGYLTVKTADGFGKLESVAYFSAETPFFIIEFAQEHKIFPQDIDVVDGGFYISVYSADNSKIGELSGITIPLVNTSKSIDSADTIVDTYEEGCGYSADFCTHRYVYSRSNFSKSKIKFTLATAGSSVDNGKTFKEIVEYIINNGRTFVPNFNPMYHYTMENLSDKECTVWADPWWPRYSAMNTSDLTREVYVNDGGNSRVYLANNSAYWNIPSLQFVSENTSMGQEDEVKTTYVDDLISRSIPDVVDMERLKYKPVIFSGDDAYTLVKRLIFDFHFRERKPNPTMRYKSGHPYYGTEWAIGEDKDERESLWNEMSVPYGYSYDRFSSGMMKTFIERRGGKSDLLGYLNFSDSDVYYRKSKLAKSFVRLSFYTSTDPIEQKLLYYSTIFLDATSLYGKYMKVVEYKESINANVGYPSVYYSGSTAMSARLDTEIIVKDEYNTESSSEGFNIYLFGDDANGINSARTIYMKVEFNHAGHGKTIPMLMWPKVEVNVEDNNSVVYGFSNILDEAESTLLVNESVVLGKPSTGSQIACVCREREVDYSGDMVLCTGGTDNSCFTNTCTCDYNCNDCGDCGDCNDCGDCTAESCNKNFCSKDLPCVQTRSGIIMPDGGGDLYTFSGYVKNQTSEPIGGALLRLSGEGAIAITDNNGRFEFLLTYLPFSQTLTVTHADYQTVETVARAVTLSEDHTIYMEPISPEPCSCDAECDGCSCDAECAECPEDGCPANGCQSDGCQTDAPPTPTSTTAYLPLTISNYLESLYIPIEIKYINNEYVYSIKGAEEEGDTLRLILFEPKIFDKENE